MNVDATGMRGDVEAWVASEAKIAIAVFFRNNPGVVDTLENVARRLALPPEVLEHEIADHVRVGLLRERKTKGGTIYMLDRRRRAEIEGYVERLAGLGGT